MIFFDGKFNLDNCLKLMKPLNLLEKQIQTFLKV